MGNENQKFKEIEAKLKESKSYKEAVSILADWEKSYSTYQSNQRLLYRKLIGVWNEYRQDIGENNLKRFLKQKFKKRLPGSLSADSLNLASALLDEHGEKALSHVTLKNWDLLLKLPKVDINKFLKSENEKKATRDKLGGKSNSEFIEGLKVLGITVNVSKKSSKTTSGPAPTTRPPAYEAESGKSEKALALFESIELMDTLLATVDSLKETMKTEGFEPRADFKKKLKGVVAKLTTLMNGLDSKDETNQAVFSAEKSESKKPQTH